MEKDINNQVYKVANKILYSLESISGTSQGKATLARLRNSIGKPLTDTIEVWSILFEYLPEEFLGTDKNVSYEEISILTTLQLYALHKQGLSKSVLLEGENGYKNIGYSLRCIRKGEDIKSSDRRFNAMITSSTFEELTYHLRHLINLMKSRNSQANVNYGKLAEDLYWYKRGYAERIRLSWAREYYFNKTNKGENDNGK